MARPRKKQHRQPSIIGSDLDRRFSLSGSGSDRDAAGDGDSTSHESDIEFQESQPVVVPQKRAKPSGASAPHTPIPSFAVTQTINYVVSVFSSAEMKKPFRNEFPRAHHSNFVQRRPGIL
jgi:hypothetical protein